MMVVKCFDGDGGEGRNVSMLMIVRGIIIKAMVVMQGLVRQRMVIIIVVSHSGNNTRLLCCDCSNSNSINL